MLTLLSTPPPGSAAPASAPADPPVLRAVATSAAGPVATANPVVPADDRPPAPELGPRAVRNLLASATEEEPRNSAGLTAVEREVVAELRRRDREVRDHEEAHARVGGQYASQPSYEFEVGPDGRRYAVGGQVQIDVAPVKDDPEATIAKMEIVKAAALAPAEPSPADRQVAALADAQRLAAIVELSAQRSERRGFSSDEIQSLVSGLFKQTDEPIEPQFSAAA